MHSMIFFLTHVVLRYSKILVLCTTLCSSQLEQFYESWRWSHFTTRNGLPSDIIEDIIETDDGTVWVSTAKGIAWYDGFRWNKVLDNQGLSEKQITKFVKGINNNILVINDNKLFVGDTLRFFQIRKDDISFNKVISAGVIDNSIFVATSDTLNPFIEIRDEIILNTYYWNCGNIYTTRNKKIYLSNIDGIFEITLPHKKILLPFSEIRSICDNLVGETFFTLDSPKDRIGLWQRINNKLIHTDAIRNIPIRSVDISSKGFAALVYETGNIFLRINNSWLPLYPIPEQLKGVNFIKFDNKDNLWVGTERGVFYFRLSAVKWKWYKHDFGDPRNIVMELYRTTKGELWVGNKVGLEIIDSNECKRQIFEINNRKLGLITGINEDNEGNVWISSGDSFEGAYKWDGRNWTHFGYKEGLRSPKIHKIRKDKNGQLWFLGLGDSAKSLNLIKNDPGAFKLDKGQFIQFDTNSGLISNRVYSFVENKNGAKWFGTLKGLSKFSNNQWEHFQATGSKNITSVYSIESDVENNIWFSNFTAQLGYIDQSDSVHWIWDWSSGNEYRQKVWDLRLDNKGILWVATTKGLFSYQNSEWVSYEIESDYSLKELRSILPLDNKIYVAGHGMGIGVLDRREINPPVRVKIQSTVVDESVHLWYTIDVYRGEISDTEVQVRYKIDDNAWSHWSKDRSVVLSNLSSGKHSFALQIKDIYGNVKENVNTFSFFVPESIIKQLLIVTTFLVFFAIIILQIFHNANIRRNHIKALLQQRTRIANDLHDEVGSNLGSISLIAQQIKKDMSSTETIHKELLEITETTNQTTEFLKEIIWYIHPRNDTMKDLETRMKETALRMLKGVEVDLQIQTDINKAKILNDNRRNIHLMFKEILHNIIKHSNATKVSIRFETIDNYYQLVIKDNGVGFDQDSLSTGNGLHNLKKRAVDTGAKLFLHTRIGCGTEFTIQFPKEKRKHSRFSNLFIGGFDKHL